jgi:hypothetical protein
MRLSRSTLHTWVWRLPQDELCQAVGFAPNTLARLCKTLRIPSPPRGHWRKVETGKAVTEDVLTDPTDDPELDYEVDEAELVRRAEIFDRRRTLPDRAPEVAPSDQENLAGDAENATTQAIAEVSSCGFDAATVATVASALDDHLDPRSVVQLLELAERYRTIASAKSLLDEVQRIRESCDPGTSAILTLWLSCAAEGLTVASPEHEIAKACRRIATGAAFPLWWREISRRTEKR